MVGVLPCQIAMHTVAWWVLPRSISGPSAVVVDNVILGTDKRWMVFHEDKEPRSACHTHTPIMTLNKETAWQDTVEKGCSSQNLQVEI
jgi:hypothetical protein